MTQGVALGYNNLPFQGKQHTRKNFCPRALFHDMNFILPMKKIICFYLSWAFLWMSSFTIHAQHSAEKFIPEQLLPDTTLAVCVLPNVETTQGKFIRSYIYQTLLANASPEIRQLFSALEQQVQHHFGIPLSTLISFFHQSIALALIDVLPPKNSDGAWPSPEVVLIADVNGSSGTLKNLLETSFVPIIQSQEPTVEFGIESFQGINCYVLSNGQFQLSYAFVGSAFVLSQSLEPLKKIIDLWTNERKTPSEPALSTLFDTALYRWTRDMAQQHDHEVRFYADVQRIWRKMLPFIRQRCIQSQSPEYHIFFELLDQYDLNAVSGIFSLQQWGGYEQLFWEIAAQNEPTEKTFGLLSTLADTGNGLLTSAQIVPATILYYGASRIDLVGTWQHLETMIETLLPSQQRETFYSWKIAVENFLQIDLKDDLFPAFGEELALVCHDKGRQNRSFRPSLPTLEDFPWSLFIQVRKKEVIEQVLDLLGRDISPNRDQEISIQTIEIPWLIMPVTVYATFVQDFFVLSLSQSVIQEIINVYQGNSLASGTDYRTLSSYFPTQGYAKGYINLRRLLRPLQVMMNYSEENPVEFPFLLEQPTGMMWVTTVLNGGFLTESRSPIGGLITGAATLWFGLPKK